MRLLLRHYAQIRGDQLECRTLSSRDCRRIQYVLPLLPSPVMSISDNPLSAGENRAIGFAYLGAAFSFSRLVASLLGGVLEGRYIPIGFLAHNPYALPSIVGTLFNAVSFVLAVVFIPETLSASAAKKAKKKHVR